MNLRLWKNMRLKDDAKLSNIIVSLFAEYVGTAILMFIGCMGNSLNRTNVPVEGPFSFGLAIMITFQCFGHISGAHVNPTITIAGIILGQISLITGFFYILVQFLGAATGLVALKALLARVDIYGTEIVTQNQAKLCSPFLSPEITQVKGLFIEFLISFIMVMAICSIWDYRCKNKIDSAPLRFGLTVTGLIIAAESTTEGHLNPVRTIVPALLNNYWNDHWIFYSGQLSGGIVAAIFYGIVFFESGGTENKPFEEIDLTS